ncbi:uncharacterized protein LOC8259020 isoform X2 [Ricinus communis]|uniref:uncharacterized protein LOC8259020 isoform X2 n=1 Tax=Ricinus communis TaxID=3988 RepID=UPI00201B31A9|nr:uncharacterized protein LOC8259020 isoform X2 [Ricinus communis]
MLKRQSTFLFNRHKALIMALITRNDSFCKGFHNLPQPITYSSSIIPFFGIKTISFNNGGSSSSNSSSGTFDFRIRSCSGSQKPLNDQRAHTFVSPHHQLVREFETRLEDNTSSGSISMTNARYINGHGTCQGGKPLGFPDYPITGNIVVAVDVDEVLGNFVSALNRFIADRYSSNHSVSEYHVYEFFKIWNCSRDEADIRVHEFFKTSYFKSGIYPIPGAQKVLQKLSRLCKLSVVTSRQNVIKDHTVEWIEKHYPGVFQEIHFGNHFALDGESRPKSEICRQTFDQIGQTCPPAMMNTKRET